jgi:hypothetical protein
VLLLLLHHAVLTVHVSLLLLAQTLGLGLLSDQG